MRPSLLSPTLSCRGGEGESLFACGCGRLQAGTMQFQPRMNTNKHQWNQRMRVPLRRNSRPSFSDCGANGRIIVRVRKFVFISVHSWFFNCMDTAKPERCSPTPSAGSTAVELMKSRKRWPAQLSNGHPKGWTPNSGAQIRKRISTTRAAVRCPPFRVSVRSPARAVVKVRCQNWIRRELFDCTRVASSQGFG
jgi:hypothetical protein